jgi:nucleotide-binding universal stress UspA family protein
LNDEKLIKNNCDKCLLPIRKILIAIDGSDASLNASTYAVDLAKRFEAELIALYVTDPRYN